MATPDATRLMPLVTENGSVHMIHGTDILLGETTHNHLLSRLEHFSVSKKFDFIFIMDYFIILKRLELFDFKDASVSSLVNSKTSVTGFNEFCYFSTGRTCPVV